MRRFLYSSRSTGLYLRTVGFSGFLKAVRGRLQKSKRPHEVKRPDVRFPFCLRVPSTDVLAYDQIFLAREYDLLLASPPRVIIDAGANIGLASIFFANKCPEAKIISIEPEAENFRLLTKNTAPYPNIVPVQAALWDKNETIHIVDPGHGFWGFVTRKACLSDRYLHSVEGLTIDKIMEEYRLASIDILKIDIQGAEKEVFRDTSSWIGKVRALIIELHEYNRPGCTRSFYNGSNGFDHEWHQGENIYLTRGEYMKAPFAWKAGVPRG